MSKIITKAKPERAAVTRKKIGVMEVDQRMRALEKLSTKPPKPWGTLADAGDKEVELFLKSIAHLPRSVFNPERWKRACGEANWRKMICVLNRGGRYQDYADAFKGDQVGNKYGRLINMYQEKTAKNKSAFTGKPNPGYPTYIPI